MALSLGSDGPGGSSSTARSAGGSSRPPRRRPIELPFAPAVWRTTTAASTYKDRPDYREATAAQVSALDDAAAKRAEFKKREAA